MLAPVLAMARPPLVTVASWVTSACPPASAEPAAVWDTSVVDARPVAVALPVATRAAPSDELVAVTVLAVVPLAPVRSSQPDPPNSDCRLAQNAPAIDCCCTSTRLTLWLPTASFMPLLARAIPRFSTSARWRIDTNPPSPASAMASWSMAVDDALPVAAAAPVVTPARPVAEFVAVAWLLADAAVPPRAAAGRLVRPG